MKLPDLEAAVNGHSGHFVCEGIGHQSQTKQVPFTHLVTPATANLVLPPVGRLQDVYDTFGSMLLYHDPVSGDAGRHLANPADWASLHSDFSDWMDDWDDFEGLEWIENCLVIGETPRSGNYILMSTDGDTAGQVFEFDHDGFEFYQCGSDLVDYVQRLLELDPAKLTDLASHMRFIDGGSTLQWWIKEMHDRQGRVVRTEV